VGSFDEKKTEVKILTLLPLKVAEPHDINKHASFRITIVNKYPICCVGYPYHL
jgi:hypothetical protein